MKYGVVKKFQKKMIIKILLSIEERVKNPIELFEIKNNKDPPEDI